MEKRYPSIDDHRQMLSAEEKVDELHDQLEHRDTEIMSLREQLQRISDIGDSGGSSSQTKITDL